MARASRRPRYDRKEGSGSLPIRWNFSGFHRRRRSRPGRGQAEGQGRAIRCSPPAYGLALLDAFLRCDPPAAGALRSRLALISAATSTKILRLNADAAALRDLRFAVGDPLGPAASLLALWRDLAGRPPGVDPRRIRDAAAALDLPAPNAETLADSLRERVRGGEDPVSAAANAARFTVSVLPDAPAAEAEILALSLFDLAIAIRLRWPRPVPLIATKILDPTLRCAGGGRRLSWPGDPGLAKRTPQRRSRSPPPRPWTSPPSFPAPTTL